MGAGGSCLRRRDAACADGPEGACKLERFKASLRACVGWECVENGGRVVYSSSELSKFSLPDDMLGMSSGSGSSVGGESKWEEWEVGSEGGRDRGLW